MDGSDVPPATDTRRFPIQGHWSPETAWCRARYVGPATVAWADAQVAYTAYARLFPGSAARQSLETLADRGGFGFTEYRALRDVGRRLRDEPRLRDEAVDLMFDEQFRRYLALERYGTDRA